MSYRCGRVQVLPNGTGRGFYVDRTGCNDDGIYELRLNCSTEGADDTD